MIEDEQIDVEQVRKAAYEEGHKHGLAGQHRQDVERRIERAQHECYEDATGQDEDRVMPGLYRELIEARDEERAAKMDPDELAEARYFGTIGGR